MHYVIDHIRDTRLSS